MESDFFMIIMCVSLIVLRHRSRFMLILFQEPAIALRDHCVTTRPASVSMFLSLSLSLSLCLINNNDLVRANYDLTALFEYAIIPKISINFNIQTET